MDVGVAGLTFACLAEATELADHALMFGGGHVALIALLGEELLRC